MLWWNPSHCYRWQTMLITGWSSCPFVNSDEGPDKFPGQLLSQLIEYCTAQLVLSTLASKLTNFFHAQKCKLFNTHVTSNNNASFTRTGCRTGPVRVQTPFVPVKLGLRRDKARWQEVVSQPCLMAGERKSDMRNCRHVEFMKTCVKEICKIL